jgi:DNA mismatch repair ATPase MutS
MSNAIEQDYLVHIQEVKIVKDRFLQKAKFLPTLRLIAFLLIFILFYRYLIVSNILYLPASAFALLGFVLLTWRDGVLKRKIERCERITQLCLNEIKGLNGDYSSFDHGAQYVDSDHEYAFDLDLFGSNSLFNAVSRCVTVFGKDRLAYSLTNSLELSGLLNQRQEAIAELSKDKPFIQESQLIFYDQITSTKDRAELIEWLNSENNFLDKKLFHVVRIALPIFTITSIVLAILGLVSVSIPSALVLIQLFIVSVFAPQLISSQAAVTSKVKILSKFAQFLGLIESRQFKSTYLVKLKQQLKFQQQESSSKIINHLFQLSNLLDANLNLLVAILLNGLFMFNLHLLVSIERWKSKYREVVPLWFDTIGEVDALISISNFAANNPDFTYPTASDDPFKFEVSELGHPLIKRDECVKNEVSISGWSQYGIVTGANMSGKSTFLRTIGVNYVLAMIGSPVCASTMVFTPIQLYSSIRTSDSLARKESFFFAELKRLKLIIDQMREGHRIFILLDEILKGTNSTDKQSGSMALMRQLVNYESVGLIATHDLVLGELSNEFPNHIRNFCFEIEIVGDQMKIDYRLKDGICQNLNATFLMRKMGIVINS